MTLDKADLKFILESLEHTRHKFENYDEYPSYEYKQTRINDVNKVILKVKELL